MQRNAIWLAHKYWWKKPFFLSEYIISNHTKKGDLILDPFCGSWSLVMEGIFKDRRVIWIDINPSSILFNKVVTNWASYSDIIHVWEKKLLPKIKEYEKSNYSINWELIRSFLRSKLDNSILGIKLKNWTEIEGHEGYDFLEKKFKLNEAFNKKLIPNSRLSVKPDTYVKDFFSDVWLYSHNLILWELDDLDISIKNFFTLAFTANVANCSKLLPPIKTRWKFAPWAWMTWYYIAQEYLDNNVFHYFSNRVVKLLKAKKYFEDNCLDISFGNINDVLLKESKYNFSLWNAQKLWIPDSSIDIIITDPPYEWVVPYLEQSFIWNAFITSDSSEIDYNNEVVVSDSKTRNKKIKNFWDDLWNTFAESNRVLKNWWKMFLTYNSIKQESLNKLWNTLNMNWFNIFEIKNVIQKTSTPRQINRKNTVDGDLLIICIKSSHQIKYDFSDWFLEKIEQINVLNYKW